TVSMGVSTRLAALPAAQPKDDREGLPLPDVLTLSSDTKKGNPIQLPSAMLRPDDARSKTTLTRSDAQHRFWMTKMSSTARPESEAIAPPPSRPRACFASPCLVITPPTPHDTHRVPPTSL